MAFTGGGKALGVSRRKGSEAAEGEKDGGSGGNLERREWKRRRQEAEGRDMRREAAIWQRNNNKCAYGITCP